MSKGICGYYYGSHDIIRYNDVIGVTASSGYGRKNNLTTMKHHLGCGERYLQGYRNIDFPSTDHTVQQKSVADERADITSLKYESGTIDEVRLHHVFEHFNRAQACGLVAVWHDWIKVDGFLHIEVPDFFWTAAAVLSPFTSFRRKMVGIRHIFGSQEAHWAVHFDGYSAGRLKLMLSSFGFEVTTIRRNSWRGTHNVEVVARRLPGAISRDEKIAAARNYLHEFCVDDTDTEKAMLGVWLKYFIKQLDKSGVK